MKKQLLELAVRRRTLLERIEIQRMVVADIAVDLQKPLAIADTGLKVAGFIRNHPGLVSGSLVALLSLRGKGIASLARKGWRLMYLYPSIFSFGSKYLFPALRSPSKERNSEVDH